MATISTLAVRLIMQAQGFGFAGSAAAATMTKLAGESDIANKSLKETAMRAAEAGSMLEKATRSARNYWRAASGGAIGGITLARAIKSGAQQEQTDTERMRRFGGAADVVTVIEAWRKLGQVVDRTFAAFGGAFNKSSGLADFLLRVAGTIQKFEPYFRMAGDMLGYFAGFVIRASDALAPLIGLMTVLGHVVVPALIVALKALIINRLILWLTGFNTAIIWTTAVKWAWAAATWAVVAALTALRAISGPVWALIAIGLSVVVAAIYLLWDAVKVALWPFVKIWQWLAGSKAKVDTAGVEQSAESFDQARQAAQGMADAIEQSVRTYGWSEQAKQLDAYVSKLNEVGDMEAVDRQAKIEAFKAQQQKLALLDREAEKLKELNDLQAETKDLWIRANQVGMSDRERAMDELKNKFPNASADQLRSAEQALYVAERRQKYLDREKEIEHSLADIRKQAEQASLTDRERRLADFKAIARTAKEIAEFEAAQNALEKGERVASAAKELADIQKEAAQAGMTESEKRLANYRAMAQTAEQIAAFERAQATIAAAESKRRATEEAAERSRQWKSHMADRAQSIKDSVSTPLEKYREKLAEITKLLAMGKLDPVTAMRAADKEMEAMKDAMGDGMREVASPKALLKGSAEALLAESRAKNPLEKLTEIQQKQLKEAEDARKAVETVATWTQTAKDFIAQF